MPENRLARETSPYLLQHKDNPVHWWPWGPEALAEANRPANRSCSRSAMPPATGATSWRTRASRTPATAAVMNELFVNIKVDREERPDIDQIYMNALHAARRAGRLAADHVPNAARRTRLGRHLFPQGLPATAAPAFVDVLREVARVFREEPDKIEQQPQGYRRASCGPRPRRGGKANLGRAELDQIADAVRRLVRPRRTAASAARRSSRSARSSSFSGAPENAPGDGRYFETVALTLERMSQGGIYDHLGGGFSRYSVDERWLVPHFEKMLYDNAQLLELLALAHARTGNDRVPRASGRNSRVACPRDDDRGRRLCLQPRRRLGRRGGQVLRLVARRDRSRAREGRRCLFCLALRRNVRRKFRRPQHPQPARHRCTIRLG